jgi:hypothetical protein
MFLVAVCFLLALFAISFYGPHLLRTSPTVPDELHCIEERDHGYIYYITPTESMIFYSLMFTGGSGFVVFIHLGAYFLRRYPFGPVEY